MYSNRSIEWVDDLYVSQYHMQLHVIFVFGAIQIVDRLLAEILNFLTHVHIIDMSKLFPINSSCLNELCDRDRYNNIWNKYIYIFSTVMGSTVRQSLKMKNRITFDDHSNGAKTVTRWTAYFNHYAREERVYFVLLFVIPTLNRVS